MSMVECPNCGMDNAPDRAFCRICGERLPQQAPPPEAAGPAGAGEVLGVDWLLAEEEGEAPPAPVEDSPAPAPEPEGGEDEQIDAPPSPAPEPEPPVATSGHLPAWLQGARIEVEAPAEPEDDWDEGIDFSNLPDWPAVPEAAGATEQVADPQPEVPDWVHQFGMDDPIQSPEREGTGLLVGVRGPIPIEPVIALLHEAPAYPGREEISHDQEAANLFAQIAGGAVTPDPLAMPSAPPRGVAFFHLLLILAILLPLSFSYIAFFGPPPRLPAATAFGETLRALPPGSTVLMAFDYEAGMLDELEPAAIATLNHLAALGQQEGRGPQQDFNLVSVSLLPQGPAMAERARLKSRWGAERSWQALGFKPGGTIGLRSLLQEQAVADPALIIVFGTDATDVQQWIEQIGSQDSTLPLLASTPALSEPILAPYLASGQLDGLLAGLAGTASYEVYELGLFPELREGRIAWRRLDALSMAALLTLIVILAGNIVGWRQGANVADPLAQPEEDAS